MSEKQGVILIAGVDEAGRGPLAGPVVAAAVVLDPAQPIEGLTDSKKLTERQREGLFPIIQQRALAWAIGRAEAVEIDQVNILQATFLAMQRAVASLKINPELILVDGNQLPKFNSKTIAIIKGDLTEPAISAASILAKVTRDREMLTYDSQFPQYGFAKHKGYPTKAHFAALEKHGPCSIHRRSFAPVKDIIEK